ncbi:hypothetical protein BN14_10440 [Rhizoctonia solani AG-1 IB]|uniref:Fungal-type protein kinase domain-containing protein n=1 Tax=Thanatephorus cucumeris (strain AG1-IB / isolate 7/3/14) TaxID=1108050 RepID=M5CGL1_THACB|nr:hypothetical protein BN14_10440 [Rhizoctonia solani AG-1 IB]
MTIAHADSPSRRRRTHFIEHSSSEVKAASSRVAPTDPEDIPAVPEATLDSLINTVLAPIPEELMSIVYEGLVSAGRIDMSDTANSPRSRWRCMKQSPSTSANQGNVNEAFKFLETAIRDIAHHPKSHISRSDLRFQFGVTGDITPFRTRHNMPRTDGYFHLGDSDLDAVRRSRIVVPMELKEAAPNQTDLGCDPSIKIAPPTGTKPSHDITVYNPDTDEPTTYLTTGILSDIGVDSMVGRGTPVWKAQKLVNGVPVLPECVLKDIWAYADREAEHVMFVRIREEQPSYAQYFLTPLDYGYVPLDSKLPYAPDNTDNMLGSRKNSHLTGKVMGLRRRSSSVDTLRLETSSTPRDSAGCFDEVTSSPKAQGGFCDFGCVSKQTRRRYRIIFKERGTPVHHLRKSKDIFVAIQGGWKGLCAVHTSKRVHRDVSSGNILLVPASGSLQGRGVITNLEYVKDIRDTSLSRDVKTGTATFMATELAAMEHKRLSLELAYKSAAQAPEELSLIRQRQANKGSLRLQPLLPEFRHNTLHDMESMWWLCIWVMFYLVPEKGDAEKYYTNYCGLFKHPDSGRKHNFISGQPVFWSLTTHLPGPFVLIMKNWSEILNSHYSICYRKHDGSATRPNSICVDSKTVQLSHQDGDTFIEQLIKEASDFPSKLTALPELAKVPGGKEVTSKLLFTSRTSFVFDSVELPPPRKRQRITATSR